MTAQHRLARLAVLDLERRALLEERMNLVVQRAEEISLDGYFGGDRRALLEEMIEHCEMRARECIPVYADGREMANLFKALLALDE